MAPARRSPTPGRAAHLVGRTRPGLSALLAFLVAALVAATPASAYWSSIGSGVGAGSTGSLSAPTAVTVAPVSLPSVTVGWTASAGSPGPTGYYVTRTSGGSTVAACGSGPSALITGTSCVDTGMADGSYTYVVTAAYRSWTAVSAPSGSVAVMTATKLAFTTQPTGTTAGSAISPGVAVTVQTATGTTVPLAGRSVGVAIGANPGSGTLSGTATATTDANGVATFSGLSINKIGVGYTLNATSTGLTSATSGTFTIAAATADRFVITSAAVSGTASTSATLGPITVERRDALGNPSTAGDTTVNLASTSGGTATFAATSGGSGVTSVTIPAGASSVTFFYGDTKAGTPTITAGGALSSADQGQTITAASATKFAFTSPAISAGAANITATLGPLTVQRQDRFGNPATGGALNLGLASSSAGAVFAATASGAPISGVSIPLNASSVSFYYGDTVPGAPTITVTGTLTVAAQQQQIVTGPAAKLAITSGSIGGVASETAATGPVTVQVRDIANNPVTSGAVVSLSSNSVGTAIFAATSGGAGVTSRTIPAGQSSVTFFYGDTKATGAGTVTVTAAATGLTNATVSGTITAAAASQLQFGQQPTNTAKSAIITPAVTVRILDRFGNLTTSTALLTIAIDNNPPSLLGLTAGTLDGDTTKAGVGGVATFNDLNIDGGALNLGGTGNGYTLKVTGTGLTQAISAPFNIT